MLIFLRVSLTLVLEGLVFLLFGYRQKRSWLVFLLVNLVTQLGVNLCIYCVASPTALEPYAALIYLGLLLYTPMEILVLVAEAIAFPRLVKEHRKRRAVGYAFVANLFSWALGGALLAVLPCNLFFAFNPPHFIQSAPPGTASRRGAPCFCLDGKKRPFTGALLSH